VTNDQRGTVTNGTAGGYNRDAPYIGFKTYKVNASCVDCSVDKYVIPPMPSPLPIVLRKNSFTANLVSTHPSTTGHKGTLFAQLFPYSWWGVPMLTTQLWHSVYGDSKDLYMTLVDEKNNALADNFIGHSTFVGTTRTSVDVWGKLVKEQVFVSIRRMDSGLEVLRGKLLLSDKTEAKLLPPAYKLSTTTCQPKHDVYNLFNDTFPPGDVVNTVEWKNGTTVDKYCGSRSLFFNTTKPTTFFINTKQRNCRALPPTRVPSKYVSLEFMVKAHTPWNNYNNLNLTISATYINSSNVFTANKVSTSWKNTANALINSKGWTMVRLSLKALGGENITCISFEFNPWHSTRSLFIDDLRFSTIPAGDSFYEGPVVQPMIEAFDESVVAANKININML